MGKFTKEESASKKQQALQLYAKGIDLNTISEAIDVSMATLSKWAKLLDFEGARKSSTISLSEIRQTILDSFVAMKSGQKPSISPDAAAKFAKAFEQLSDQKKCIPYMYEAYDTLTEELLHRVQDARTTADKTHLLSILKDVRSITQDILTRLTNDQLKTN